MGKMHLVASEGIPRKSSFIRNNDNLDQLLQRFWGKKNCLGRQGQLKKFCVNDTSRSSPHEMKRDVILRNILDEKLKTV